MSEGKLFDFQKEVVDSKEKFILCNWSRGLGKTYTIVNKILKEKPQQVLYINGMNTLRTIKYVIDKIIHINNDIIQAIDGNGSKIKITYKNNKTTTIYSLSDINRGIIHNQYVDIIIFDDILPHPIDYKTKQTICMISTNNGDKHLQRLYPTVTIREYGLKILLSKGLMDVNTLHDARKLLPISSFYNEIDITTTPNNTHIKKYSYNRRLEELNTEYLYTNTNKFEVETLAKLQTEFDNIPYTKDTVKTRQNLLEMILQLRSILNDSNEYQPNRQLRPQYMITYTGTSVLMYAVGKTLYDLKLTPDSLRIEAVKRIESFITEKNAVIYIDQMIENMYQLSNMLTDQGYQCKIFNKQYIHI